MRGVREEAAVSIARNGDGSPTPRYDAHSRRMTLCQADDDGYCTWSGCPQNRDAEPRATGRHCPYDREPDYDGQPVHEAIDALGEN